MNRALKIADVSSVLGAVFAALCCAGLPFIVSGLALVGLSFLRRDSILWPLMIASLLIALWGFWQGSRMHGRLGPLLLGVAGAGALVAGVIFVHGPPAYVLIYAGVCALFAAVALNVWARHVFAQKGISAA